MPFLLLRLTMQNQPFKTIEEVGIPEFKRQMSRFNGFHGHNEIKQDSREPQKSEALQNEAVPHHLVPPGSEWMFQSSKLLMEGVHFDPAYTPLKHLGYKSVVAGVSSLVASAVSPSEAVISFGIPNKYSLQMILELLEGADHICKEMRVNLRTADVTASHQRLVLSVHAIGFGKPEHVLVTNKPAIHDAVCVTGDLGGAIAGLRILLREKQFWMENPSQQFQPDLSEYEYVVGRQLHPSNPVAFLDALKKTGIMPSAMVSVSEGLVPSLKELLEQTSASINIYSPSIPVALETRSVANEMEEDVDKYAFYGGEDYEYVFTLPQDRVSDLEQVFGDIRVIGELTDGEPGIIIHTGEGEEIKFKKH